MQNEEETLTHEQAFLAMFAYLEIHFERFGPGEVGTVLSEMCFLPDGSTVDPAAWGDWEKSVEKAKRGEVDTQFRIKPKA